MINYLIPVKHFVNLFYAPAHRQDPIHRPTTSRFNLLNPAHRFRRNRCSAEEVRIIDPAETTSTQIRNLKIYERIRRSANQTRRRKDSARPASAPATSDPAVDPAVAPRWVQVVSSARHAGENFDLNGRSRRRRNPRNRSGKRTARAVQVWRAIRARCVCVSTEGALRCRAPESIYMWRTVRTENLSGTRDRWGEPGDALCSSLFVHPYGAPPR